MKRKLIALFLGVMISGLFVLANNNTKEAKAATCGYDSKDVCCIDGSACYCLKELKPADLTKN